MSEISVTPIPILKDNYVWAVIDNTHYRAVIVDPGEAAPVIEFLEQHKLALVGILLTHKHWDHTNGFRELKSLYNVPVFASIHEDIPHITHPLNENESTEISGFPLTFKLISIPGHTLGHAAYYADGILFSGDTLFACGCGRIFEGTPAQMLSSLQKLAALPNETKIYCGHEYTLSNLRFAAAVEPGNQDIVTRTKQIAALREKNIPSLPSTMADEKKTNPFLRCDSVEIRENVEKHTGRQLPQQLDVFTELREWKNNF